MCGTKLKQSLLLLVALFCLSAGYCWAESPAVETMTDAEIIAELMSNLEVRENLIIEKEKSLDQRELNLTEREDLLIEREAILNLRKNLLSEIETSWKNSERDVLIDRLIWFGIGSAAGFIGGGYSGFKLGLTVSY